jgi:uncharacterized protein
MNRNGKSVERSNIEKSESFKKERIWMKDYDLQTWKDPRIESRRSAIIGNGMFARELTRKGEIVSIIGGKIMTEAEFEAFQASHSRYNAIQVDENLHLVEMTESTATIEGSINHSCDSNVWMADEITLTARQDIAGGEELTVDYGLFTVQANWMLDAPCHYGSPYCRHRITGNDWKQKDIQKRYRNHFSPFINRRIENMSAGDSLINTFAKIRESSPNPYMWG